MVEIFGIWNYLLFNQFCIIGDDIWNDKLSVSPSQLTIKNMQKENFGTIVCSVSDNTPIKSFSSKTFRLIKVNGKIKNIHVINFNQKSFNFKMEKKTYNQCF